MLIVKLFANEKQIDEIMIQNISSEYGVGWQNYIIRKPELPDVIVQHEYSKGYIPLLNKVFDILNRHQYHPNKKEK